MRAFDNRTYVDECVYSANIYKFRRRLQDIKAICGIYKKKTCGKRARDKKQKQPAV